MRLIRNEAHRPERFVYVKSNALNFIFMSNPSQIFLEEAADLLTQIEEVALNLKPGLAAGEEVAHLFRAFHTIKGSGSMFGFDAVAGFTHHVETVLDEVRGLGECTVIADLAGVPLLEQLTPDLCTFAWEITLRTSMGLNAIKDVFIFVEEDSEIRIDAIPLIAKAAVVTTAPNLLVP